MTCATSSCDWRVRRENQKTGQQWHSFFLSKKLQCAETIIFALIERACFKRNASVYVNGDGSLLSSSGSADPRFAKLSFLEFFLLETVFIFLLKLKKRGEKEQEKLNLVMEKQDSEQLNILSLFIL